MKCNVLRDSKVIYNFGILTDDFLKFFFIIQKKPIVQIKSASALNRIMVLCDNTISMLNMLDLEVRQIVLNWISYHCAINVYLVYLCIKVHIASFTDINMKGKF